MEEIAELTEVTPAIVLGTCSFYTMFKRRPCGRLLVSVCTNVTCLVTGGPEILEHLESKYAMDDEVDVEEVECIAACGDAPAMQVNYEFHEKLTPASAEEIVEEYKRGDLQARTDLRLNRRECDVSSFTNGTQLQETRIVTKRLYERPDDSWTMDAALASGCYDVLRDVLAKDDPAAIQDHVVKSGLRGRGGANFSCGQKWSFLPQGVFPRYLVVNADEGEPSTFKDRMLVERDPHQLIEGIVISAYAIGCNQAFIYLRGEFALGYDRLAQAIADARAKGFLGTNILGSGFDLELVVHRGAGAYICGEETALLESLEGERGMPRLKPPFPAIEGLYAKPTVVNNVETLSTVPHIVRMGGEEYAKLGVGRSTGTRIAAISGHVNRPGNYEVEFGCTFRDLIYGLAGGIRDDNDLKFFLPGGASFQWLVGSDEHLDAPYDMDFVQQNLGTTLGSGAIMVFDETTDPLKVAWRLAKFYSHESCGKCTPCREGTGWIEKVLYRMANGLGRPEDLALLTDIGAGISPNVATAPFTQTTLCPLGPSVVSPIASLNKYFRAEIEARLASPAEVSA